MSRRDDPIFLQLLEGYGLQDCLLGFAEALEVLQKKRGFSIEASLIIEILKGIHTGYLRRYDGES